jgi:hypothetical protein
MNRSRTVSGFRTRRNKAVATKRQDSQLHGDLVQLMDIQRTQLTGMPPSVRDKTPMTVKRLKVHTFVQSIDLSTITPSTSADTINGYAVALVNVPTLDLTAFTTLFDQWRIVEVQYVFAPLNPASPQAPLYTAIDVDGSTPVTLASLLGYETLEITDGTRTTIRTFVPQTLVAGATISNFLNAPGGTWIDCASPGQAYYGLLWAIPALSSTSATPAYRVTCKAVFQFRSLR